MGVRLGYACQWGRNRPTTWSGTPFALLQALQRHPGTEVVDLGIDLPVSVRAILKGAHYRRVDGAWTSGWKHSRALDVVVERRLRQQARRLGPDVVLQIHDLAPLAQPSMIYQDLSIDAFAAAGPGAQLPWLRDADLVARRARQARVYERTDAVVAMSRWLATDLVEVTGLPEAKVHVVHAGINAPVTPPEGELPPAGEPRRLLFVGKAFHRKGGDLVVEAWRRLRRTLDPDLRLTVVGPATWPLAGGVPDGVDYLGLVAHDRVAELYRSHDVFVMPSRFEAFGVVFGEALVSGRPCVARDAFAMPELVRDGVDGRLIPPDGDADELARVIEDVLGDVDLQRRVHEARHDARRRFGWDRAAGELVEIANRLTPAALT